MDGTNNLNGRVLSALIDFDLVVNTELGLIRFIRENFQDERAFNLEILNKSDREILSLLFSRKDKNPLSIISTEENLGDIDKLYKSFFDTYQKEIIDHSTSDSTIYKFVELVANSGSNFGTISFFAVRNEIEKESLRSHFGNLNFIDRDSASGIMAKDIYYVKDCSIFTDLGLQDRLARKKIYFSPRQYNLDYFEEEVNSLTSRNVYATFGKNYSVGVDANENDQDNKASENHQKSETVQE